MLTTRKATKISESNAKTICKFYDIHRHKTIRAKLSCLIKITAWYPTTKQRTNIDRATETKPHWTAPPRWKRKQCAYTLSGFEGIYFFFYWHYSPSWTLASSTTALHWSQSCHFCIQFLMLIIIRSSSTESCHLTAGLPTYLVHPTMYGATAPCGPWPPSKVPPFFSIPSSSPPSSYS
jgi:hypothetical protein